MNFTTNRLSVPDSIGSTTGGAIPDSAEEITVTNHNLITALVSGHGECELDDKCADGMRDEIPEMRTRGGIPPCSEYTERERKNEHKWGTELNTNLGGKLIHPKSATGNYQKIRMCTELSGKELSNFGFNSSNIWKFTGPMSSESYFEH